MDFAGNGTSKPKQEAKCLLETKWKLPRKTADIWDELDVTPGSWNCYIIVYSSITITVTPVTFKDLFHYPIAVSGHKHSSQANPTQPGRTKMQEKAKKKHFCCSFFFWREGSCCNILEFSSHKRAAALFLPHWDISQATPSSALSWEHKASLDFQGFWYSPGYKSFPNALKHTNFLHNFRN